AVAGARRAPGQRRHPHGAGADRGGAALSGRRRDRDPGRPMRYMQDGGFQGNGLMRLTLGLTLGLLLAFWVTNFGMYFSRMSLRPSSVAAYYNGSEQDFRPPRSVAS